jgi:hypothetical protein
MSRDSLEKWLKESKIILDESLSLIKNPEDAELRWKLYKANRGTTPKSRGGPSH